jgi:hypothetical protein
VVLLALEFVIVYETNSGRACGHVEKLKREWLYSKCHVLQKHVIEMNLSNDV